MSKKKKKVKKYSNFYVTQVFTSVATDSSVIIARIEGGRLYISYSEPSHDLTFCKDWDLPSFIDFDSSEELEQWLLYYEYEEIPPLNVSAFIDIL